MFNRSKLSDGSELFAHIEEPFGLVLANVNGSGTTVWQERMTLAEARAFRDFLNSQALDEVGETAGPRPR